MARVLDRTSPGLEKLLIGMKSFRIFIVAY